MMRSAITFFCLALLAILLGANGIAGFSVEIGKTLLVIFLIMSICSFLVGAFSENKKVR